MESTNLWMEKGSKTHVFRAAIVFSFVLLLFPWFDPWGGNNIAQFDRLLQSFTSSGGRAINTADVVVEQEPTKLLLARLLKGDDRRNMETTGFACENGERFAICVSDQSVRIDINGGNITVHVLSNDEAMETATTNIHPYAGHRYKAMLELITPVKIITGNQPNPPACKFYHDDPVMIFSSGFTGNIFHEFNDIIIPLFLTTKYLDSRVHLVLEDYNSRFAEKFGNIISRLSTHEIINVPRDGKERSVHCFPGVVAGLRFNGHLSLNSKEAPQETLMHDFRRILRASYGLHFTHVTQIRKKTPRLMLLSREGKRMLLNENEAVSMLKEIGFEVVVARPQELSNLDKYAKVINSCGVFVGVHGAGLVNELFLPDEAIVVQVVPLGLEWAASFYYEKPAAEMGLHYMKYTIEPEESSLLEIYDRNHSVIRDPDSIFAKGYQIFEEVYLTKQHVRINVDKFRETLLQAFKLVTNSSSIIE